MLQIQYIHYLLWLLAILPVALLYIYYEVWKKQTKKKIGDEHLVNQMLEGVSSAKARLKTGFILISLVLLAVALINIQKPVQEAGGGLRGLDVMIALDVSNSMLANDVSPNRLERARLLAAKLIDTLQGNRVGIIAFAGNAYLQLPLTTDLAAARLYLQSVSTALVPTQGTNIYEALQLANQSMDVSAHDYKAVVLITDGEELDKKAMDAAKELKQAGVVLLTTGVGTAAGATILTDNGGTKKDENGKTIISRLNEKLLQQLAEETNGTYRLMGETDATLHSITAELRSMNQKSISNANMVNYKSYSYPFIAIAFLLLLFELLLPERAGKRKVIEMMVKKSKPVMQSSIVLCLVILFSITGNGQNANLLLRKANEAYRLEQYETASKLYGQVLKADPGNAIATYNMGNIAYRKKQFEAAVKQYDAATEANKKKASKASALNNKGLSYIGQKNLQEAIDAFKQSVRENPYDGEVRMNLNKAIKEKQKEDQQQKKDQQDPNKQPDKTPPPPKNKIKKNEAEDKLAALRQEEKKIRDKMNKQPAAGQVGDKDW